MDEVRESMNCQENVDRISELPDDVIHHILSCFPSTEERIRTAILSKRWRYHWSHVPSLIFNLRYGMSINHFSDFIDGVLRLHDCPKLDKFVINSFGYFNDDLYGDFVPKLDKWIRFATEREVKEFSLECYGMYEILGEYRLPEILFKNKSLHNLKLHNLSIPPIKERGVHWPSLKALYVSGTNISSPIIENILSGSPLIEYLKLSTCKQLSERFVICSESLKKLCINVHSGDSDDDIVISCPKLEKLDICGFVTFKQIYIKKLPSSVCATLDFENYIRWYGDRVMDFNLVKEFLSKFKHVEDLWLGPWLLKLISVDATEGGSSILLNSKWLSVIDCFSVIRNPAFSISHFRFSSIEKLTIQLSPEKHLLENRYVRSIERRKKFSDIDRMVFDSLLHHLKTIEIVGISDASENSGYSEVLEFIEFLLKNSNLLDSMVLTETKETGIIFAREVCDKLSRIQKDSPCCIISVASMRLGKYDSDWNLFVN